VTLLPLDQLLQQHPGLEVRRDGCCHVEGEALILQCSLAAQQLSDSQAAGPGW
jgi:hypothetical protein